MAGSSGYTFWVSRTCGAKLVVCVDDDAEEVEHRNGDDACVDRVVL